LYTLPLNFFFVHVSHSRQQQFSPLASPQQKHAPQQQQQPFSVAKKAILNKNQSASDLTQWINPDLLM